MQESGQPQQHYIQKHQQGGLSPDIFKKRQFSQATCPVPSQEQWKKCRRIIIFQFPNTYKSQQHKEQPRPRASALVLIFQEKSHTHTQQAHQQSLFAQSGTPKYHRGKDQKSYCRRLFTFGKNCSQHIGQIPHTRIADNRKIKSAEPIIIARKQAKDTLYLGHQHRPRLLRKKKHRPCLAPIAPKHGLEIAPRRYPSVFCQYDGLSKNKMRVSPIFIIQAIQHPKSHSSQYFEAQAPDKIRTA